MEFITLSNLGQILELMDQAFGRKTQAEINKTNIENYVLKIGENLFVGEEILGLLDVGWLDVMILDKETI